jgi:hypothetical protein
MSFHIFVRLFVESINQLSHHPGYKAVPHPVPEWDKNPRRLLPLNNYVHRLSLFKVGINIKHIWTSNINLWF